VLRRIVEMFQIITEALGLPSAVRRFKLATCLRCRV
jgi:hypothetical protein